MINKMYIYIYMHAVKLKLVQDFPFYKLKIGPFFLFYLLFIFKNIILPAERRGFLKNKQNNNQKKHNFIS